MMSTGDVARYFGISRSTVRRWMQTGYLPVALQTPAGHYRFDEEEIEGLKDMLVAQAKSGYAQRLTGNVEVIH